MRARVAGLESRLSELPPDETAATLGDLADRERRLEDFKFSEVRYRRLFETAKDGILILDADTGQVTDVNPFLEGLLGYTHAELLGKKLWEIGPFRDVVASQAAFRELQGKEYIRYENLPLETKAGEHLQVEFVSSVYLVEMKRVVQCNIRDITARRLAEDGVRKANEDLTALVAELQRRDSGMQQLNRINDLLQTCNTREEAYEVISLMAGDLFPGQSGSVARLHARDHNLETVARWGSESAGEAVFSADDCWAMRRGQPHHVKGPHAGLMCRHVVPQPGFDSLCVPLTVQGETMGLLSLVGSVGRNSVDKGTRQPLALTFGEAIKLSLSNIALRVKLREQATHDPLTGLFNRRFLEEVLSRELHRVRRSHSPLCVAMLDLDHFKKLNDAGGHEAGDSFLRELGRLLRKNLRRSDIPCRYGGEEFALVFPDSSLENTVQRVEQIRGLVKSLDVRLGDQTLGSLTVSGGVALASERGCTVREILGAADSALYAAKQAGRNRVVIYDSEK